jgi:hypothetical protein
LIKRNPAWSREELILALELYLARGIVDDRSAEVIELSKKLGKLAAVEQINPQVFRNPNGVAMKLGNFAALDPNYSGKGLRGGGKNDKVIWDEFADNPYALAQAATQIRANLKATEQNTVNELVKESESTEFQTETREDTRVRIASSIVSRRGQNAFRQSLLNAYSGKCAFSDYNAADALEAAHILGYLGKESHHICNGLLLRADIHTLFDLGLLAVQAKMMIIDVAPALLETPYAELEGKVINVPKDEEEQPSVAALELHWEASKCS